MESPRTIAMESGVIRPVLLLGAERLPAGLGIWAGFMMVMTAVYGQWRALYGLPFVVLWHGIWVLAAARDPQYGEVMWRQWIRYSWPPRLHAQPCVLAKRVKCEPSVPVRG
jgi:type IV secretory pathway TrbD component